MHCKKEQLDIELFNTRKGENKEFMLLVWPRNEFGKYEPLEFLFLQKSWQNSDTLEKFPQRSPSKKFLASRSLCFVGPFVTEYLWISFTALLNESQVLQT